MLLFATCCDRAFFLFVVRCLFLLRLVLAPALSAEPAYPLSLHFKLVCIISLFRFCEFAEYEFHSCFHVFFRAFVTCAEVVGTRCSRLRLFASFLLCCLPLLLLVVACAACLCELVLKLVVVRSIRVGILLLFGAAFYLLLLLLSVIVFRAPCFGFLFSIYPTLFFVACLFCGRVPLCIGPP